MMERRQFILAALGVVAIKEKGGPQNANPAAGKAVLAAAMGPFRTINEIRALEDLHPLPEEWEERCVP